MPLKWELELKKQNNAARIIQQAWKRFLDVAVFQHFKNLINIRRQGEPRHIAELLDAAAGINVRFRLGGIDFPPNIYYKIFTHRHIEDMCANSPKDYTKLPAKQTSYIKSDTLQEDDHSGWYHRIENNGWRPVSESFWMPIENVMVADKKESEFHFSKLKRKQDLEKKRKIKKVEWMRHMYYTGSLEAKSTNLETLDLIHTATKGLIRAVEDGGIDSVMDWEVDEVLNWTNALNFDEYIANWKEIATSNSSANFKGFKFEQAQKKIFDHEDISEKKMEILNYPLYQNVYVKQKSPRQTPEST
ncbi:protein MFI isoform X2 [Tamandua tetradactyla]|uniref:protein MFI isoform X2 n=1 Tax=Tamandua tetradactyla TaxID=48850 RepID=UPI0040541425